MVRGFGKLLAGLILASPASALACGMYYPEPIALSDVFDSIDAPQLTDAQREEFSQANVARIEQVEKVRSTLATTVASADEEEKGTL